MRIISGQFKGKPLISPEGTEIRPTSDRTREALFNLLMHMDDCPVTDQSVLDLCCGSGALGLEALSRGAAHCSFIDNAPASLRLAQQNIDLLGVASRAKTIQANASQLPGAPQPVALVMMDPPYRHETIVQSAGASLRERGWIRAGSIISIEQFFKAPTPELSGCEIIKQRKYGKSVITLLQML